MNKGIAAIFVLVGIMLLYVSFYGLSGFGLPQQLSLTTGFKDYFDDTKMGPQWKVPPEGPNAFVAPTEQGGSGSGKLVCSGTGDLGCGYVTVDSYNFASGGGVSVDWAMTSGNPAVVLLISTSPYASHDGDPSFATAFSVRLERTGSASSGEGAIEAMYYCPSQGTGVRTVGGATTWQQTSSGTFAIKFSNGVISFTVGGTTASWTPSYTDFSSMYVSIWVGKMVATTEFKNFELDSANPTPSPSAAASPSSSTSSSPGTSNSASPSSSSGQNNPNFPDILAIIKGFVESQTAKTFELLGGIAMLGIGVIGLLVPNRKYPPMYPAYRPYG